MPPRPRKRSKPNPQADAEPPGYPLDGVAESKTEGASAEQNSKLSKPNEGSIARSATEAPNASEAKKTWYGGTWPKTPKAIPVTQVAKESISAARAVPSETLSTAPKQVPTNPSSPTSPLRKSSLYLPRNGGGSSRSLPLVATTTKINITSNSADASYRDALAEEQVTRKEPRLDGAGKSEEMAADEEKAETMNRGDTKKSSADILNAEDKQGLAETARGGSSGWMGWFARSNDDQTQTPERPQQHSPMNEAQHLKTADGVDPNCVSPLSAETDERRKSDSNPIPKSNEQDQPSRSWLGFWGTAAQPAMHQEGNRMIGIASSNEANAIKDQISSGETSEAAANVLNASTAPSLEQPISTGKSSGWAFWSRDHSVQDATGDIPRPSSVVVAESPSAAKPEPTIKDETKIQSSGRPRPVVIKEDTKIPKIPKHITENPNITSGPPSSATQDKASQTAKIKQDAINLVLPSFEKTFGLGARPNLIQQLGRLLPFSKPSNQPKHVSLLQEPSRIKKALAIGVHGYFPAPLIRSVLGQPTGTSMRFANGAANAIQSWTARQGYSCEIEKIALEGEGKIAERLEVLWKLLLNWIEDIRKADFVMIACHSQGVPVAMMLISKLIAFGCVSTARIGVCAMAGVNLGPFGDYKSRWISGSAGELFEFAQEDSRVSKEYESALSSALRFGVRVLYIGSIDDQLVSLESSTFGTVNHPYIFRAVFIDGRIHAPNFLSHLVGFALKLRNLGISDHGLIRELSIPLAGSLYGGEGHSRLYEDDAVYYLGIQHALETTSVGDVPIQRLRNPSAAPQNPYILPFAMRGLLEEDYVRTELHDEMRELLKQFEHWKPSSKVLKDVKFRLEGVKFKL